MIRIGIFGSTGFTGYELLKIFALHSEADVRFVTSETHAGKKYSDVYPCVYDYELITMSAADLHEVDVVFLCMPHGVSAELASKVMDYNVKCIDLSADFRLRDVNVYEKWYETHKAPEMIAEAVYGLPELYREKIVSADLIANPGCYPTSVILGAYPLLKSGLVSDSRIIADSKSGVSGAGVKPSATTHYVNVNENFAPYKIGHSHRHVPEIEQELSAIAGASIRVTFTPHLLPVTRGILTTQYITTDKALTAEDATVLYQKTYKDEPFVQTLPAGQTATLSHAVNTNLCVISVHSAGAPGELIVVSAIDNLIKGASGQAVQNMNIMFGADERMGLER